MNKVFLTSDLHLAHDREFIYRPRGFNSVEEMNQAIIHNWNSIVDEKDVVFILGDLMLGDNASGIKMIEQLNGLFYLIRGNHDTDTRIELYRKLDNCVEIYDAKYLKYNGYHFYLTHYPCLTGNLHKETLKQMTLNLHGHTHAQTPFFYDLPFCYNVGVDAHNCMPISFEQVIEDMKNKVEECKSFL